MKRIRPKIEVVSMWESVVSGLGEGFLLIEPGMLNSVIRSSEAGNFFPFVIERRLPECDKGELIAVFVELVPEIEHPT